MEKKRARRRGFTLVETIVVVGLIGLLLGIAAPSLARWQHSAEIIRLNQTARTIFLSAQEAFSNARGSSLYEDLCDESEAVRLDMIRPTPPDKELDKNSGNIRFLTLDKGGSGSGALRGALSDYLADQGVLQDSILVEFNQSTGVVRAVFYSTRAPRLRYDYGGDPQSEQDVVSREAALLEKKRQGYYGVDYTGTVGESMLKETPSVRIVNGERLTVEWNDVTPTAYDESVTYDLTIFQNGAPVMQVSGLPNFYKLSVSDVSVAEETPTDGSILYKDPLSGQMTFVLDCLHHSITRYPNIAVGPIYAEVTAQMPGSPGLTGRSNEEHAYFASENPVGSSKGYQLANARHLNNMRYAPRESTFEQVAARIDWQAAENDYKAPNKLNFVPARFSGGESFAGTYKVGSAVSGGYGVVAGLTIDPLWTDAEKTIPAANPQNDDVGLFAILEGADIENLVLEGIDVHGNERVGAFAGSALDAWMNDCHLVNPGEPVYSWSGDTGGGTGGDEPTHPRPGSNIRQWQEGESYAFREIVIHNGKWYLSVEDGNGYEPGVEDWWSYLWRELPTPDLDGEWPEWAQPTDYVGYSEGDQVTYDGQYWISLQYGNLTVPNEWEWSWAALGPVEGGGVDDPGDPDNPDEPYEPGKIPPTAPAVEDAGVSFAGLSCVRADSNCVGGLVGQSDGGTYRRVSAGGVVYAGGAMTARVNKNFGNRGEGEGRLVLDYALEDGGGYAGGLLGVSNGDTLEQGIGRALVGAGSLSGGIAGQAQGMNLVSACSVGDVSGTSDVGGYFGGCGFDLAQLVNEANVMGNRFVGGIVGRNEHTVAQCENKGMVRALAITSQTMQNIGGIAGENRSGAVISGCKNSSDFWNLGDEEPLLLPGAVSGAPEEALLGENVGGIAGSNGGEVRESVVTGNTFGRISVGGVVGYNEGLVSGTRFADLLPNTGIVQGLNNVGGVIGRNRQLYDGLQNGAGQPADPADLTDPERQVDVSGMLKVLSDGKNVGGFIGLEEKQKITGLVNQACVIGKDNVGGVVGSTAYPVEYCANNGIVQGGGSAVGGVAGLETDHAVACGNEGRVSALGGRYVGGVIGSLEEKSGSDAYASDCYNRGLVENPDGGGTQYLAGVVGQLKGGSLDACFNEGPVGSEAGGSYVAGVVGLMGTGTVSECYNGSEDWDPDDPRQPRLWNRGTGLGGIVGYANPSSRYEAHIEGCMNYADLYDTEDPERTGGIVASAKGSTTVEYCENYGEIQSLARYVGGVIGYAESDGVTLGRCGVFGSVTGGSDTGGVAGSSKGTIEHCEMTGELVEGDVRVGGIAGSNDGTREVVSCVSEASVEALGMQAGGIAGSNRGTVRGCTMRGASVKAGKTQGASYAGGLVGNNGNAASELRGNTIELGAGGALVEGDGLYVGGFAGINDGLVEENTTSGSGEFHITGGGSTGGLVGYMRSGTLRQYENGKNFTVEGRGIRTGGFVGESRTDIVGLPERHMVNTATVVSEQYHVGGIVGENKENTILIRYCDNEGSVTGDKDRAGGILGGTQGSKDSRILDCVNRGEVRLSSNGTNRVGGIVGAAQNMQIERCYNQGVVESQVGGEAGGIAGGVSNTLIYACENTAEPKAAKGPLGGITGSAMQDSRIWECNNLASFGAYGALVAADTLGGIAGRLSASQVTDCQNVGDVFSAADTVGGIAGSMLANSTVERCYNLGGVTGRRNTGGIAGKADQSTLLSCQNTGSVSGASPTGGVVGLLSAGSSAEECQNSGSVSGSGTVGGIAGVNQGALYACVNDSDQSILQGTGGRGSYAGGIAGDNAGTIASFATEAAAAHLEGQGGALSIGATDPLPDVKRKLSMGASGEEDAAPARITLGHTGREARVRGATLGESGVTLGHSKQEESAMRPEADVPGGITLGYCAPARLLAEAASGKDRGGYLTYNTMKITILSGATAGGIAGRNSGVIDTVYNEGEVLAQDGNLQNATVGGLVGYLQSGTLRRSLSLGDLEKKSRRGGVAGERENESTIFYCFFYSGSNGLKSVAVGPEYVEGDEPDAKQDKPKGRRLTDQFFEPFMEPPDFHDAASVVAALKAYPWPARMLMLRAFYAAESEEWAEDGEEEEARSTHSRSIVRIGGPAAQEPTPPDGEDPPGEEDLPEKEKPPDEEKPPGGEPAPEPPSGSRDKDGASPDST